LNAVLCRSAGAATLLFYLCFSRTAVAAQEPVATPTAQQDGITAAATVEFLAGGALAFVTHEGGHLIVDGIFDAGPRIEGIHFGPVPFFAIAHRPDLSPRREFTVSSAGFWTQEATSEWLLTQHPDLRHERAAFKKGMLAFDVLTSVGYGVVAFAKAGPFERDTRGMADAIGVDERAIGAMVIAPAALDAYRYFQPHARWAVWASRAAKVGSVLLVLK
jgi:hypothetical protein